MDYKKMTETRQSCRAFDPVRTPDRAVLTQVLEAARLCLCDIKKQQKGKNFCRSHPALAHCAG